MSKDTRPFDLSKLDFEGNRKRLRKKLLLRSVPIVVIVLLICAWLLLPFIATMQAKSLNDTGSYKASNQWLDILETNIIFEPYKRPFNQAIVATNDKRFDDSSDLFRQSVALAPESQKCFIRLQSVLSEELAGDNAVSKKDPQAAIVYYTKALSDISTYSKCFSDYITLSFRISAKLATLIETMKKDTNTNDDTKDPKNTTANTETPSDDQMKKLEQLQKQGQINKQEAEKKSNPDYNYSGKRW